MSTRDRTLLTVLSMGGWRGSILDKAETLAIAQKHGTMAEVARVTKTLLPMAKTLDDVKKVRGKLRAAFYKGTAAWGIEGTRILRSDAWLDFNNNEMQPLIREDKQLVKLFVADYPKLAAMAPQVLNGMYNPADYPTVEQIESKFYCTVRYYPMPDAPDWRLDMPDADQDALKAQLEADKQESFRIAMSSVWERLHDVVKAAADKLADPQAVFRDSLITNALDLCKLLPSLNITDDPHLETMRQQVEGVLSGHTIATIRQPGFTRSATANKMADIMAKMGAMYGA